MNIRIKRLVNSLFFFLACTAGVMAQDDRKTISNCRIVFDVMVLDSGASRNTVETLEKAVKTSYVRNNQSRNEFETPGFKQVSIFKTGQDTVVLLKEIGNTKYISYVDTNKFGKEKMNYDGIRFVTTRESKNILGYECRKAQAQLPDGTYLNVFYSPILQPTNKDFELQFKSVPGLVLEYESYLEDKKTLVKFIATHIDFNPQPAYLFDWPKAGYKLL